MTRTRACLLVLALASSCGGSGEGLDDGGTDDPDARAVVDPPDLADLPQALEDAFCELVVRCGFLPDLETCRLTAVYLDDFETIRAGIEAGRIIYRADQMLDCMNGFLNADCTFTDIFDPTLQESCLGAFEGTVADGAACIHDEECLSDDCDIAGCPDMCCPGTCGPTATHDVPIGSPCSWDGDCVARSWCNTTSVCQPTVATGESCTDDAECDYPATCYANTCRPLPDLGEDCNPAVFLFECNRLDNYCDTGTLVCEQQAYAGEACSLLGPNPGDDTCINTAWCNGGACQYMPLPGETCVDNDCLGDSTCDASNTCVAGAYDPVCTL